jgi:hypothetical protein
VPQFVQIVVEYPVNASPGSIEVTQEHPPIRLSADMGVGGTIKLENQGTLNKESGVTVVMNNITLEGLQNNTSSLVVVGAGHLILEAGAQIKNNEKMGTVQVNEDVDAEPPEWTWGGAGVWVQEGKLTMSGGKITGNKVCVDVSWPGRGYGYMNIFGGGVYVGTSGTFIKAGGGEISENVAEEGNGNQIYQKVAGGSNRYCDYTVDENWTTEGVAPSAWDNGTNPNP